MMTNLTLKTWGFAVVFMLAFYSGFSQRPVQSGTRAPSAIKEAYRIPQLNDDQADDNVATALDTVMLMEKTSNAFHIRIDPKEGATLWRYRLLGDLPEDAEVEESAWTTGMSVDTCCFTIDNLDAQSAYVLQFGRIQAEEAEPTVWYSMVETTRCMGISLDQMNLIGLDYNSASMMCNMDATSFEWVLRRVGGSSARHIETTSNTIEWTNLPPNTAHECRVRYMCGGIWSDYSPADVFTTSEYEEHLCEDLSNDQVYTSDISTSDVQLNCKMTGEQYSWSLRLSGTETWTVYNTGANHYKWLNLKPGKTYEYKVKVNCQGSAWTDWSNVHYFKTKDESSNPCYSPGTIHLSVKNITYNSASTYCSMDGYEYHWSLRAHGSSTWKDHISSHSYHHWTGLSYGTKYEYRVKVKCHGGTWTGWSGSHYFSTEHHYGNSCTTPQKHHMSVKDLTYHSAITHCAVDGKEYHWYLREYGSNHWLDYAGHNNFYSWTNLHYNTKYEYKVKVKCHNGKWTGWSDIYWFQTPDHYGSSCGTPKGHQLSVKDLTYNSVSTHCAVSGYEYHWRLKPSSSYAWLDHISHYNHHQWAGLHYGTKYEFQVKVKCHDGKWTSWSDSYWFTTPNHYGSSCGTPQSHHLSVKELTYQSARTHCSIDGYEYHWKLKPYGSNTWWDKVTTHPYHDWGNLQYNTKYEFNVKVKCHNGTWTGWSGSYWFTTPHHNYNTCGVPQKHHLSVKNLTYNSATTHCSVEGYEYHWYLRPYGTSAWMDYVTSHSYYQWNNLHYKTKYEYKVKVKCHNGWTGWSAIYWFETPDHYGGCGTPQSHHLSVKNITYNSASTYCSVEGYGYHWALRPKGGYGWSEYHSGYNHYNWTNLNYNTQYEYKVKVKCHDGTWTDWSGVQWFSTHDHYNNCGTPGSHHMNIQNLSYDAATTHCGVSGYEYHWMLKQHGTSHWQDKITTNNYHHWTGLHYNTKYEYKVKVKCHSGSWTGWSDSYWFTTHDHHGYGCSAPYGSEFNAYQQDYNHFRIYLYAAFTSWSSQIRVFGTYEWAEHTTSANNIGWGNLHPNTKYEYRVRRSCADGTKSDWSAIKTFWTGTGSSFASGRASESGPLLLEESTGLQGTKSSALTEIEMFPNPASTRVTIYGVLEDSEIVVLDMQGRVLTRKILGGDHNLDVQTLDNGIYQLLLVDRKGQLHTKRLAILK
jgi:putative hemolysin